MQVSSLTDNELRNLIDMQPENLDAVREGARRFVEGSSEDADLIAQLREEVTAAEGDAKHYEDRADDLRKELDAEVRRLKGLIQGARRELADA